MYTLKQEYSSVFKRLEACGFRSVEENDKAIKLMSAAVAKRVEKISNQKINRSDVRVGRKNIAQTMAA